MLRVFGKIAHETEITVFYALAAVRKFAVYDIYSGEGRSRHFFHEFPVLSEKGHAKIVFFPITQRVPFIRPVTFSAIYRKRSRRMNGDNIFAAKLARVPIECMALFSPSHPSDVAAARTPRGRWNLDFFVECEIFRSDRELLFAILAIPIF